jgi:hypothetical protein
VANGHGGVRGGSGRKKKTLVEKIIENEGKKPKVIKFKNEIKGEEMPSPAEYLSQTTKGAGENRAKEIFEKTWLWLRERKCDIYITPQLVEQYAMSVARWIQAEEAVHQFGFLAKHPTTGAPISSPYVKISQDFMKQSTALWLQIYGVVKENCSEFFGEDENDIMTKILNTPPPR